MAHGCAQQIETDTHRPSYNCRNRLHLCTQCHTVDSDTLSSSPAVPVGLFICCGDCLDHPSCTTTSPPGLRGWLPRGVLLSVAALPGVFCTETMVGSPKLSDRRSGTGWSGDAAEFSSNRIGTVCGCCGDNFWAGKSAAFGSLGINASVLCAAASAAAALLDGGTAALWAGSTISCFDASFVLCSALHMRRASSAVVSTWAYLHGKTTGSCWKCHRVPTVLQTNSLTFPVSQTTFHNLYCHCGTTFYYRMYTIYLQHQHKLSWHIFCPAMCNFLFSPGFRSNSILPSVLWHCWLGGRKGIWRVKSEWWGSDVVICLERGADLLTAQLMPMSLSVSCFSKIQIRFTFLVPAYPDKGPWNVYVCVSR